MKQQSREIVAGSALGLLVGALVGLSSSPVAANFLGVMTALLAAFFGLRGSATAEGEDPPRTPGNVSSGLRIASFSLACLAAILLSLFARTHALLSPSAAQQVGQWTSAGYTPTEARQLAAYQLLGILPANTTQATPAANPTSSVLFGVTTDECRLLDPSSFANARELNNAWQLAGLRWQKLAQAMQELSDANRLTVAKASWELVCR